jgi:2-amino-4-hydroxy-6-hydroxymethyldihydropteridine diphosphokinase/dihydropteroate synthase
MAFARFVRINHGFSRDVNIDEMEQIQTKLSPMDLLDRLQSIENTLGRVKLIDKGPRNIDLDILTYNDEKLESPRLTVPHALMLEREFVLRPLCE